MALYSKLEGRFQDNTVHVHNIQNSSAFIDFMADSD